MAEYLNTMCVIVPVIDHVLLFHYSEKNWCWEFS